jgi:hypothetical protein
VIATFVIAPISKFFLAVAIAVGIIDSLISMEELTGGKVLSWLSLALILIVGFCANSAFFEDDQQSSKLGFDVPVYGSGISH